MTDLFRVSLKRLALLTLIAGFALTLGVSGTYAQDATPDDTTDDAADVVDTADTADDAADDGAVDDGSGDDGVAELPSTGQGSTAQDGNGMEIMILGGVALAVIATFALTKRSHRAS
jgi:hypothetical protein